MGFSLVAPVLGLLIAVTAPVVEVGLEGARASEVVVPGLQSTGSMVVAHGLSCFAACGVFPHQGSNPCFLHLGRFIITEPPGEALKVFVGILLQYWFYFMFVFFFGHETCGILVLQLQTEPTPPGLEAQSLNPWTIREVPIYLTFFKNYLLFLAVLGLCCCVGFL